MANQPPILLWPKLFDGWVWTDDDGWGDGRNDGDGNGRVIESGTIYGDGVSGDGCGNGGSYCRAHGRGFGDPDGDGHFYD